MKIKKILSSFHRLIISKSGAEAKVNYLRKRGVKIGNGCRINTLSFSTEPYLIEIGDQVTIAEGTLLIAHDAGILCFRDEFPKEDVFGKIKIGNNVLIGSNCIIMLNTEIGNNCIIGAGSVVRGVFPDNSVIAGNPAKVLINTKIQRLLYRNHPGKISTRGMSDSEKKPLILKLFEESK